MPKPGGTIYAIGAVGTSWVKIGSTRAGVAQRLKILQTGQPFPLQVLAIVPVETDVQRIEHQVHVFLAEEQRRGEWFEVAMDAARLEALVVCAVQYVLAGGAGHERRRYAKTLGDRIRQARERVGLTQRQLAERIGCQQSDIHRLESGLVSDPHMSRLVALAQALQVSTDWLSGLRDTTDEADTAPPPQPTRQRTRKAAPVA
jgi:DNA-binding XRE family transcriptional regulator